MGLKQHCLSQSDSGTNAEYSRLQSVSRKADSNINVVELTATRFVKSAVEHDQMEQEFSELHTMFEAIDTR